jgi:hypothetical protein
MGLLTVLEGRVEDLRGSARFQKAWKELRAKHHRFKDFDSPDALRDFCQDPQGGYERQDPVVFALCAEARNESETRTAKRPASDLLFWIFVPALWKVVEQAQRASDLDPEDIQAEVIEGFWKEAVKARSSSSGLSGALVNAGRHQVWRAIRSAVKEAHAPLDVLDSNAAEPNRPDPEWADPWLLICYALHQDVINEVEAELLFWIKLQEKPVGAVGEALGLSYSATHSQLRRVQEKLAHWVAQLGDKYPPRDPSLAREIRNLAQKPPNLAQLASLERDQIWP